MPRKDVTSARQTKGKEKPTVMYSQKTYAEKIVNVAEKSVVASVQKAKKK